MTTRSFGHLPGEGDIEEILISAGDLTVSVLSLGAVIRDCRLAGVDHPLVLGFDRLEDYIAHSQHFGTIAGRCANRIGAGRFAIDGANYQVSLNEGRHHLHGGFKGWDKVVVKDAAAPPMWARFYEIGTNKPIFCSRDGVPKDTLAEISYERRNGYSWLGRYAADLLAKDYPAWQKKWAPGKNVLEKRPPK